MQCHSSEAHGRDGELERHNGLPSWEAVSCEDEARVGWAGRQGRRLRTAQLYETLRSSHSNYRISHK